MARSTFKRLYLYARSMRCAYWLSGICYGAIVFVGTAWAQSIPGPADVNRITPFKEGVEVRRGASDVIIPEVNTVSKAPEGAENTRLLLQEVRVKGATIFSAEQLEESYAHYVGKEITLDTLWVIAERITQRYRNAGYFLSRAYIPAQSIQEGIIRINVVEGRIGRVRIEGEVPDHSIIRHYLDQLTAQQPIRADAMESIMLRLNDLPGIEFRAVLEPLTDNNQGAAGVVLKVVPEEAVATLDFDNAGSRFLGPYQASAAYQDSIIPLQHTTFSAATSLPADELRYGSLQHTIPLFPEVNATITGSYVTSEPGASLAPNNIESSSVNLGVSLQWEAIRQRQENLSLSLSLDGRNSNGDILNNTPLTRDRIRVARLGASYDTSDRLQGYNYLNATLSQGLEILGASDEGDLNLSRAQANPDFTTVQFSYSRFQALPEGWSLIARTAGQLASDPLFSSEEFGYGGSSFGRAYDSSEITGDHGIAASVELRYPAIDMADYRLSLIPYGFYDIGRVWNEDARSNPISAASAGGGVRFTHDIGISGDVGVAWPLTKDIDTPIYGDDGNPRLRLQLGAAF